MPAFVNPFVSGRHRRLVGFGLWLLITVALLTAGGWFWRLQLQDSLREEARAELAHFDRLHISVSSAFEELQRTATAQPCSDEFIRELRRVAFKPDGLNEFMYAPGGIVTCSTSISFDRTAVSLGTPDIKSTGERGFALWVNTRLDSVGLPGITGNVALQEPFALVIPPQTTGRELASWVKKELVMTSADGRRWHLSGGDDIFSVARGKTMREPFTAMYDVACGDHHGYCVAVKADLAEIAFNWRTELLLAIGLIGFYAIWPASAAHRAFEGYWSFESRFLRHLDVSSIVCAYQPILDLRTGKISGVEVLARWRDLDSSIVSPDKFIDIVSRAERTLAFTTMVADRAHDELSRMLPDDIRLQVNFNIFPRDLDSDKLRSVFSAFEAEPDRFHVVIEIVESDSLGEDAQREIEALARDGIRTYLDDFGSGYSSIHRVASLSVHGVKLDRSFAMAPNESLMARMLVHALDMLGSSGCEIVVEGVETQERLELLVASGRVASAQGYLISRPLPIDRLADFLAKHDATSVLATDRRAAA